MINLQYCPFPCQSAEKNNMTFSLLARDSNSSAIGGVAATGSLCVGGWVLRGAVGAGMSASQGMSPSTLWGEDVLTRMRNGDCAQVAVDAVTTVDPGRDQRQLTALAMDGRGAVFSGPSNTHVIADRVFDGGVAAGNLLAGEAVIDALVAGYRDSDGPFAERLLAGLFAADAAGSDKRGLLSAALLVLSPDRPPLTLRVDHSESPLEALAALYRHATTGDYAEWAQQVPTLDDPTRTFTLPTDSGS